MASIGVKQLLKGIIYILFVFLSVLILFSCPAPNSGTRPVNYPRLIVAQAGGIFIWDNIDEATGDPAADYTLGGFSGNGLGLAVCGDRLIAGSDNTTNALYFYDGIEELSDTSTPAAVIGTDELTSGALSQIYGMNIDSGNNLWLVSSDNIGSISLFANVPGITSSSTMKAQFSHNFQQIYSGVYDPVGVKLIGGQISGAGILVYDDPLNDTGAQTEDWKLKDIAGIFCFALSGNSLYGCNLANSNILIWRNISGVSTTTEPDVTLNSASNGIDDPMYISIYGNKLVVTNQDGPSNYNVKIFLNASTINGSSTAASTITDTDLVIPTKALLDMNDNLYVLMNGSILIFENATTAPSLKAKIDTDITGAKDMLIVE